VQLAGNEEREACRECEEESRPGHSDSES
jgi:hypothetical protein